MRSLCWYSTPPSVDGHSSARVRAGVHLFQARLEPNASALKGRSSAHDKMRKTEKQVRKDTTLDQTGDKHMTTGRNNRGLKTVCVSTHSLSYRPF